MKHMKFSKYIYNFKAKTAKNHDLMSKKSKKIDDEIEEELYEKMNSHVNPHQPLVDYFKEDDDEKKNKILEDFADFYEKKTKIAVREMISVLFYIAGANVEINEKHISKEDFDSVKKEAEKIIEELTEDSEIYKLVNKNNQTVCEFWNKLAGNLSKNLFKSEIEIFKNWVVNLTEDKIRSLRQSACICVFSLADYLAENRQSCITSLEKLKEDKAKSPVRKNQISDFETEKENCEQMLMDFFTSVIKITSRDIDHFIRQMSLSTTGKLVRSCPDLFGDDNTLRYISNALNDEDPRLKKLSLQISKTLLKKYKNDLKSITPFFKRICPNIIKCCDDRDNILVVSAFQLLTEMAKMNMLKDTEKTESLFVITGDGMEKVREAASKFFATVFFNEKANKKNKAELNERYLRKFADLCEDMTTQQITNSIDAHWDKVASLAEFELIAQILVGSDDPDKTSIFAKIFTGSAKVAAKYDENEILKDFTKSMIAHFSHFIEQYDDKETLKIFLSSLQYINVAEIDKVAASAHFKKLLTLITDIADKTDDDDIYNSIIHSLFSWLKSKDSSVKKQINTYVKKFFDTYSNINSKGANIKKLSPIIEFFDYSKDIKLRDALKNMCDGKKTQQVSHALKCLETLFKWDIKHIKDGDIDPDNYQDEYDVLFSLFSTKLYTNNQEVIRSAFSGMSTIISLVGFLPKVEIDSFSAGNFFKRFHEVENNFDLFNYLQRPIICNAVNISFSPHILWYYQYPEYKQSVKNFVDSNKKKFPAKGQILAELVRNLKHTRKIKLAMKYMSSLLEPRTVIDGWLDNANEKEIVLYEPFFMKMNKYDAELLETRAEGKIREILIRIKSGKKPSRKDFIFDEQTSGDDSSSSSSSSSDESDSSSSSSSSKDDADNEDN